MQFAILGALILLLVMRGRQADRGSYALMAAGAVVAGLVLYYR